MRPIWLILLPLCGHAAAGHAAAAAESAAKAYTPAAGPFEVAVVECFVLTDTTRGKRIELRVQYPKRPTGDADGKAAKPWLLPLIIFSHGAGGSKDGAVTFTRHSPYIGDAPVMSYILLGW